MSLSVLIPTREPPARVAAVLAPLRGVADEVVVAIDHRIEADRVGAYEDLADRIVRFEFSGSNRGLAWLHAQCSGERVLTLAGDEAVSAQLERALPGLCAESDIRQHWFPMRWVWPDGRHWLNELPWWPDFHNRLVRNDEALWFEGRKHTGAYPQLPMRYVELPIYHLALVLQDRAGREDRVRRYEAQRPGLLAPGGGPLNERYYLPERFARLAPVEIPAGDQVAVTAVLKAGDTHGPIRPPRHPVPISRRAEIDAFWAGRPLSPDAYHALIEPFERSHAMACGDCRPIFVRVRNHGTACWPAGTDRPPEIRLSYHWQDTKGRTIVHDGLRTAFPAPLRPGAHEVVPTLVQAPETPGVFVLVVDLVHEHVRWFGCETRIHVTVGDAPRASSWPGARSGRARPRWPWRAAPA